MLSALKPTAETYSATTSPRSSRDRSRPLGQARPRWTSAAPEKGKTRLPNVNDAELSR
jgi:hypothetical protein